MKLLARAARLLLGAIFLWASVTKVPDMAAFAESVANYRIVPPALVPAVAAAVVGVEIAAGVALVLNVWARAAALVLVRPARRLHRRAGERAGARDRPRLRVLRGQRSGYLVDGAARRRAPPARPRGGDLLAAFACPRALPAARPGAGTLTGASSRKYW